LVLRALSQQILKEEMIQVKEVIAASIGTIGQPEGAFCVDSIIKLLSGKHEDIDPNVKAMAVWALGRLAS